jgi:hypothetical protein
MASYHFGMDTNQEARIERQAEYLARELKKTSRGAYWLGIAIGLLFGLALGVLIGYQLGSDTVLIVPLESGVEV